MSDYQKLLAMAISDWGVYIGEDRLDEDHHSVIGLDGSRRYLTLHDTDLLGELVGNFDLPERYFVRVSTSDLRHFVSSDDLPIDNSSFCSELLELSAYLAMSSEDNLWVYAWW
jgi:hypothetical protein